MARSRTRRGPKVNWLPTFGQGLDSGGNQHSNGWLGNTDIAGDTADFTVVGTALTFDEPRDDDSHTPANSSLADFIGSGYFLRRIVGKFHCGIQLRGQPDGIPAGPPAIRLGLGFFVAREADQSPGIPIGDLEDYNPLETDNMREPWIWRRTWILTNPTNKIRQEYQISQGNAPYGTDAARWLGFPTTTAGYGSVLDGPHIDQKTKRTITNDDRLWVTLAAHRLPINEDFDGQGVNIDWWLDYRLLGSLIRAGHVKGSF